MGFTIAGDRIVEIDILLDPVRLARIDVTEVLLPEAAAGDAVE
jgi:hypothetical protein